MPRTAILLLLTAVMFLGCSEESGKGPSGPSTPTQLYTIEPGKTWIFDAEEFLNDTLTYRGQDTIAFDSASVIWAGERWYPFRNSTSVYLRNGVDGVWMFSPALNVAEKLYAYPARAGDSYFSETMDVEINVVSTAETVSVPAGNFDGCYYYRLVDLSGGDWLQTLWIKPGVGIVQRSQVIISNGDTLRSTLKLKQY